MKGRSLAALVATVILAGACGSTSITTTTPPGSEPPTTTTTTTSTPSSTTVTTTTTEAIEPVVPALLGDFALTTVFLDGVELLVAEADTSELRQQGLMGVDDLGDLAGMLFVFPEETTGGFWMKDTLLALDIAFFTSEGSFVDGFVMEPCTTPSCPTYRPGGAYVYALELPAGDMPESPTRLEFRR